jgi:hypothetical protein
VLTSGVVILVFLCFFINCIVYFHKSQKVKQVVFVSYINIFIWGAFSQVAVCIVVGILYILSRRVE